MVRRSLVIGAGSDGAGIARDAVGSAGCAWCLLEKDDLLAQATSSASTKLSHAGLRLFTPRFLRITGW